MNGGRLTFNMLSDRPFDIAFSPELSRRVTTNGGLNLRFLIHISCAESSCWLHYFVILATYNLHVISLEQVVL